MGYRTAAMYFDEFKAQLPDTDPAETAEWLESLDDVVAAEGIARARFLMFKLLKRSRQLHVGLPALTQTRYINTISPEQEPDFPGDEQLERRIRRLIRWNAVAMVLRANNRYPGIGGHLSTYASSASLYEVGFNWFFRGKDERPGDRVFYQGHAAPGMYARAFLEGRLTEDRLDHFRREVVRGQGLSSYPHPRLMPDFWEYPTVSMGLGPLAAVYQARFDRYMQNRGLADTTGTRVWAFLGDGEMDEPEALAGLSLAAREGLDNLTFVVNCNLQRLDGPVRGNGKIIQELEGLFRGAGWNVIKVIWSRDWDPLLARDTEGVLVNRMNETLDGEYQKLSVSGGAFIREHFFGPDPRLRRMVEDLDDDALARLRRGGHDYRKLYAAYRAATEYTGAPTVILAHTIKGWTLGAAAEGRNVTHQVKKLSEAELRIFRDRLELPIPDAALKEAPYFHPGPDSEEVRYMLERRRALGGSLPKRIVRHQPLVEPAPKVDAEFDAGSATPVSTTMAFAKLLRNLIRDEAVGARVVPIIPDEARTFGMDPLFKEVGIYAALGQRYEPVDSDLILSYREATNGQVLEEGINEAGSMASLQAAGTAYATQGVAMVPFYIFYSMFGFQRTGDQAWAFGDARGRGFLMGATAGRTTLHGEGLQHDDGHSHLLASTCPASAPTTPPTRTSSPRSSATASGGCTSTTRTSSTTSRSTTRTSRCPRSRTGWRRGSSAVSTGSTRHPTSVPARRRSAWSGAARSSRRSSPPATSSPSASAWRPRCTAPRRSSCSGATRSWSNGGTGSIPGPTPGCRTSHGSSARRAARSSRRPTGSRRSRTRSPVGSPRRSSRSARTATGAATRARRCARSSRWTHRRSRTPPSARWKTRARSLPGRPRERCRISGSTRTRRTRSLSDAAGERQRGGGGAARGHLCVRRRCLPSRLHQGHLLQRIRSG